MLRNYLRKTLNLDEIVPTKYYLTNRENGTKRSIKNFDEVFIAIKTNFPQYNWLFLPPVKDLKASISEYGLLWAQTRLIVSPTGSNIYYGIFMKKIFHNLCCIIRLF